MKLGFEWISSVDVGVLVAHVMVIWITYNPSNLNFSKVTANLGDTNSPIWVICIYITQIQIDI